MNTEQSMISLKHVRKSFGSLDVLKDISLEVKEGEVVVIIGPSGSGKSTILRCINGLETPTDGMISFEGITLSGEANINEVRREVGMVFQRFNLFPNMTVLQNIMLAPMKVRKIRGSSSAWLLRGHWPCSLKRFFLMNRRLLLIQRWFMKFWTL